MKDEEGSSTVVTLGNMSSLSPSNSVRSSVQNVVLDDKGLLRHKGLQSGGVEREESRVSRGEVGVCLSG